MGLSTLENLEFGGVDSRSNPLNMPRNRFLRCLNWVPKQDGHMELRWGCSTVSVDSTTNSQITSLIPYTLYTGTRYVIRFQGTTPYQITVSSGAVTNPTVRGTAFGSSAKGSWYNFSNHLHYGNGTDQKWFDGTTWRDNGIRALTSTEVANVIVQAGVTELTAAQNSTISITQTSSGGSFATQSLGGMLFYVACFDTTDGINELGPATVAAGSGRIQISAGSSKVTLSNLPSITSTQVKLIARTGDGTANAYFCTTAAATNITSFTRSGTTVTVSATSHGRSTGDVVVISGASDSNYNGVWAITVTDANTFTFVQTNGVGATSGATGGTVANILKVAAATTTIDVTATNQDTSVLVNDANRGIPQSTIGGTNPGYQFYACLTNQNAGGHVGNMIAIGSRLANTTARCNVRFRSLPDTSGIDTEFSLMIGRTGDGASVPYACTDSSGNHYFVPNGFTTVIMVNNGATDGNSSLPTRNGVIPSACDKFAVVGDYVYAADSSSATIRRSGSAIASRQGLFVGLPEQSWAANDIETFPPNQVPTCIAEVDLELFVASTSYCAILTDLAGVLTWRGPWRKGCAGKRAYVRTDHGLFWVSNDKELCTFVNGLPMAVSEEYEAAELSQIGSAFLSTIECCYYRNAAKNIDEIRIEAQKSDGTPYTIIHDFRLRDERSEFGQGRAVQFSNALTTFFTVYTNDQDILDSNGDRQIWAGSSTGNIYQLYNGSNDAGTEFSADAIALPNAGPERLNVPYLYYYGDKNTKVSFAPKLSQDVTKVQYTPAQVIPEDQGQPNTNSLFRVALPTPEVDKVYVRFQLTSHSADGSLALNSPPHVPLETYGRIWETMTSIGEARGR